METGEPCSHSLYMNRYLHGIPLYSEAPLH
jgi:hypothetical protein